MSVCICLCMSECICLSEYDSCPLEASINPVNGFSGLIHVNRGLQFDYKESCSAGASWC